MKSKQLLKILGKDTCVSKRNTYFCIVKNGTGNSMSEPRSLNEVSVLIIV